MKNKVWIFLAFCLFLVTPAFANQAQDVNVVPLDFGIKQQIVSVGNTATPIPATALSGRNSIMIKNLDSATVYIGSATVTANTSATGGFPLAQNEVFKGDIGENTIVYGIVAAATNSVSVIEAR